MEQGNELALKQGKDFYLEGGAVVFTEDFLKRRGVCCKSGCRHCPFGFREKMMMSKIKLN